MVKREVSRLGQAKQLVADEIDQTIHAIEKRSDKYRGSPQKRRQYITIFGAKLHVLHVMHTAIIDAQRRGLKDADAKLRHALLESLEMPAMYIDGNGKLQRLFATNALENDKAKFIELIS